MKRTALLIVLVGTPLAACSNTDNTGDGGGGGSCTHVAVCTVLPLDQVNMACGTMAVSTTNMSQGGGVILTNDNCKYIASAGGANVVAGRLCFASASGAQTYYQDLHDRMLETGEMRVDITGVGDKGYVNIKSALEVDLRAIKGNVVVEFLDLSVATGQQAMAQQGLTTLATTLIAK